MNVVASQMRFVALRAANYPRRNIGGLSALQRYDPTRTLTLRKQFVREVNRRFRALAASIKRTVAENDAFGLTEPQSVVLASAADMPRYAFARTGDKTQAFMDWLEEQVDSNVLEVQSRLGTGRVITEPWTNVYIRSAYQKGISRGRTELRNAGEPVPDFGDRNLFGDPVSASFNQPFHAERVAALYTRTFTDLKGITATMDAQISRTLAEGLVEGRSPQELARTLVDRVESIGAVRARALARTEVIRAHHVATIGEYRQARLEGVAVRAEWSTAGYNVCPDCAQFDGQVFDIDTIESMIPFHPNCRCVAIPAGVGERETERGIHPPGLPEPKASPASVAARTESPHEYGDSLKGKMRPEELALYTKMQIPEERAARMLAQDRIRNAAISGRMDEVSMWIDDLRPMGKTYAGYETYLEDLTRSLGLRRTASGAYINDTTILGTGGRLPLCPSAGLVGHARCLNSTDVARVQRAIKAHVPATYEMQALADANEVRLSGILRGARTGDNAPFDVVKGKHYIEVKTIIKGKHDKITMRPECLRRKLSEVRRNRGAKAHTVVFDERTGKIYYRSGVGSFRLSSMQEISVNELTGLF